MTGTDTSCTVIGGRPPSEARHRTVRDLGGDPLRRADSAVGVAAVHGVAPDVDPTVPSPQRGGDIVEPAAGVLARPVRDRPLMGADVDIGDVLDEPLHHPVRRLALRGAER